IYAEAAGHGRSCEAYHSVAPHPQGIGICRAMEKSLRRAMMEPREISYINAHGTAMKSNDLAEIVAIRKIFGNRATRIPVSSTKPVTGHLLAAAGAIEAIVCALAIKHEVIPPTINFSEPIDGCYLD